MDATSVKGLAGAGCVRGDRQLWVPGPLLTQQRCWGTQAWGGAPPRLFVSLGKGHVRSPGSTQSPAGKADSAGPDLWDTGGTAETCRGSPPASSPPTLSPAPRLLGGLTPLWMFFWRQGAQSSPSCGLPTPHSLPLPELPLSPAELRYSARRMRTGKCGGSQKGQGQRGAEPAGWVLSCPAGATYESAPLILSFLVSQMRVVSPWQSH